VTQSRISYQRANRPNFWEIDYAILSHLGYIYIIVATASLPVTVAVALTYNSKTVVTEVKAATTYQ